MENERKTARKHARHVRKPEGTAAINKVKFEEARFRKESKDLKEVRTREQLTLLDIIVSLRPRHIGLSQPNSRLPQRSIDTHSSRQLRTSIIVIQVISSLNIRPRLRRRHDRST